MYCIFLESKRGRIVYPWVKRQISLHRRRRALKASRKCIIYNSILPACSFVIIPPLASVLQVRIRHLFLLTRAIFKWHNNRSIAFYTHMEFRNSYISKFLCKLLLNSYNYSLTGFFPNPIDLTFAVSEESSSGT